MNIDMKSLFLDDMGRPSVKAGLLKTEAWLNSRNITNEDLRRCMFPKILGVGFQRQMSMLYDRGGEDLNSWKLYCGEAVVPDFKKLTKDGPSSLADLLPILEGNEAEDAHRLVKMSWDIKAEMFGRAFNVSFQSIVNDDVGFIQSIPEKMNQAAQEWHLRQMATAMTANAASQIDGAAMWSAAHGNLGITAIAGATLADAQAIEELYLYIQLQRDPQVDMQSNLQGRPMPARYFGKYLVVPRNQMASWCRTLCTAEYVPNAAGILVNNPLFPYKLEVVENMYLPNCSGYWMFSQPSPSTESAFTFAYLRDFGNKPVVLVSTPSNKLISGGDFGSGHEDFNFNSKFSVLLFSYLNDGPWYGTAAYPNADTVPTAR